MPIIKSEDWKNYELNNTDVYGKCCVDVAREVMRLLDKKNLFGKPKKFDTHKIINKADDNISAGGITGFMAGCVASMVSHCHSRGEEFRKKWNEYYGVTEKKSKGGVVNPAIMTIETN